MGMANNTGHRVLAGSCLDIDKKMRESPADVTAMIQQKLLPMRGCMKASCRFKRFSAACKTKHSLAASMYS